MLTSHRETHNEVNLNEYCISYTTCRTKPKEYGGHFYIASYGIRIPGRADQLVSWRGKDLHGTTASDCDPLDENPAFNQSGIAFIMDKNLLKAYERASLKRKTNVDPDDMDLDEDDQPIVLDDSSVRPVKRATMPVIEHGEDWGKWLYRSEIKNVYTFPTNHAYEKKTIAQIRALLDERGVEIKKSARRNELIATVLADDGVEFGVVVPDKVPRVKKERKKRRL